MLSFSQGYTEGPVSIGQDCVWKPPKNVTFSGDKDTDFARVVDSSVEITMLTNPIKPHNVLTMTASIRQLEELLHTNQPGEQDLTNVVLPPVQRGVVKPWVINILDPRTAVGLPRSPSRMPRPSSPPGGAPQLGAISGRKLLQQLGSISGGASPSPPMEAGQPSSSSSSTASLGAVTGQKVGLVLERDVETRLVPQKRKKLSRAEGLDAVSICQ